MNNMMMIEINQNGNDGKSCAHGGHPHAPKNNAPPFASASPRWSEETHQTTSYHHTTASLSNPLQTGREQLKRRFDRYTNGKTSEWQDKARNKSKHEQQYGVKLKDPQGAPAATMTWSNPGYNTTTYTLTSPGTKG